MAIIISNIIKNDDNNVYIIGANLIPIEDVYSSPIASHILNITTVTKDVTCISYIGNSRKIMINVIQKEIVYFFDTIYHMT